MVRTRADRHVLWPRYFDSTKTRATGRRVPKSLAVQNPTSEELMKAVNGLGLEATLLDDKAHPSAWWEHEGCVTVEKSMKKSELIGKVGAALKKLRQSQTD